MRLIDVDALFEELNNKQIPWNRSINDIIMAQPTAYDVEKVVEQIRSEAQLMSEAQLPHRCYKAIGSKKVRAIIRKGGVSERD